MPDGWIAIQNVVSRTLTLDQEVEVHGLGKVVGDVAYGGNWFYRCSRCYRIYRSNWFYRFYRSYRFYGCNRRYGRRGCNRIYRRYRFYRFYWHTGIGGYCC